MVGRGGGLGGDTRVAPVISATRSRSRVEVTMGGGGGGAHKYTVYSAEPVRHMYFANRTTCAVIYHFWGEKFRGFFFLAEGGVYCAVFFRRYRGANIFFFCRRFALFSHNPCIFWSSYLSHLRFYTRFHTVTYSLIRTCGEKYARKNSPLKLMALFSGGGRGLDFFSSATTFFAS